MEKGSIYIMKIRNIEVGNIRDWDGREMSTGMQHS